MSWSVTRSRSSIACDGERGRADRVELLGRRARPSPRRRRPRPGASPRSGRGQTRRRPARAVCSGRSRAPKATRRGLSGASAAVAPVSATTLSTAAGRRRRAPRRARRPSGSQSSRPGKRASRSARRRRLSRVVPWGRCWITPASRSTLKWCVQVDLVTGRAKLPQVYSPSPLGQLGHDPQPHRVAERVQNGAELELLAAG